MTAPALRITRPTQRDLTALHEAAHAVVAMLLGRGVTQVWIGWPSHGRCEFQAQPVATAAMVALGHLDALRIPRDIAREYEATEPPPAPVDVVAAPAAPLPLVTRTRLARTAHARELRITLAGAAAERWRTLWLDWRAPGLSLDRAFAIWHAVALCDGDRSRVDAFIAAELEAMVDVVSRPDVAPIIDAVARALLTRRVLTGAAVRAIAKAHGGLTPAARRRARAGAAVRVGEMAAHGIGLDEAAA